MWRLAAEDSTHPLSLANFPPVWYIGRRKEDIISAIHRLLPIHTCAGSFLAVTDVGKLAWQKHYIQRERALEMWNVHRLRLPSTLYSWKNDEDGTPLFTCGGAIGSQSDRLNTTHFNFQGCFRSLDCYIASWATSPAGRCLCYRSIRGFYPTAPFLLLGWLFNTYSAAEWKCVRRRSKDDTFSALSLLLTSPSSRLPRLNVLPWDGSSNMRRAIF